MKVWLAGSGGMLAHAVRQRLEQLRVPLVCSDLDLDIAAPEAVSGWLERERPSCIVNCAAFTRVDDAESEVEAAFRVNARGPTVLAEQARLRGLSLLHYSTDYVFDGQASAPYLETAPYAPASVYGKSKLEGELGALRAFGLSGAGDAEDAAEANARRAAKSESEPAGSLWIVRTSWLFGAKGQHFVDTMLRLMAQREELQVVVDQRGRPTHTVDLARASLALAGIGSLAASEPSSAGTPPSPAPVAPSGVYHFANAGETSWHGFASTILELGRARGMDLKTRRVLETTTQSFPRPAPRPAYSVLDTTKLERTLGAGCPPWTEALRCYLEAL